jgi:diacylglycerol kinase family enzyme
LAANAVIVANPRSGGAASGLSDIASMLQDRLAAAGVAATRVAFPDAADDREWPGRLHAAIERGADAVYVLGGDGSVLTVARAMLGHDCPLGIVPLGTANLLARDLGIPLEPEQAVAALVRGRVERIDVARCNGVPFLCAAMLGMPADLARAREAARGLGAWRMLPNMLRRVGWVLKRYPFYPVSLTLDDRPASLSTRLMIVSNNPVDPSRPGIHPARTSLTGGELGVYGVHEGPLSDLPRLALTLLNGTWPDEPRVFHDTCSAADIRTKHPMATTALMDGEHERLHTPLRFDSLPGALPVLVPTTTGPV